jgi:hypothetical protein
MDMAVSQRQPNLILVRRVLFISGLMLPIFSSEQPLVPVRLFTRAVPTVSFAFLGGFLRNGTLAGSFNCSQAERLQSD